MSNASVLGSPKTRQELEQLAQMFLLPKARTQPVIEKVADWMDEKLDANGGKYVLDYNNVDQMNEVARFVGFPECEHARAFLAVGAFHDPARPNATTVAFKRTTDAAEREATTGSSNPAPPEHVHHCRVCPQVHVYRLEDSEVAVGLRIRGQIIAIHRHATEEQATQYIEAIKAGTSDNEAAEAFAKLHPVFTVEELQRRVAALPSAASATVN